MNALNAMAKYVSDHGLQLELLPDPAPEVINFRVMTQLNHDDVTDPEWLKDYPNYADANYGPYVHSGFRMTSDRMMYLLSQGETLDMAMLELSVRRVLEGVAKATGKPMREFHYFNQGASNANSV